MKMSDIKIPTFSHYAVVLKQDEQGKPYYEGKIPLDLIATAYGLGYEKYFDVLKNAMNATKWNDFTGDREPGIS